MKRNKASIGDIRDSLELVRQLKFNLTEWQDLASQLVKVVAIVKRTKVRGFADPEVGNENRMAVDEYCVLRARDATSSGRGWWKS
jgi:hypothetical protein